VVRAEVGVVIPFVDPIAPPYGRVEQVSAMVRRVVAENPSKYTYKGTGTYIVGRGEVAVIDPGPLLDSHREALAEALKGERVTAILVTHCHADHSPLAAWLREESGAPTYAFGPHGAVDDEPEEPDEPSAGSSASRGPGDTADLPPDPEATRESIDLEFRPDVGVADGDAIRGAGWTFEGVHTPGHTSNHLCFALAEERALFTGDHVMGWSTTVVSPPDGDMRAYCESLRKLQGRRGDGVYWPTHGGPITDPGPFVEAYLAHRLAREAQVLGLVRDGVGEIRDIVAVLYADVRAELHRAAGRSVYSHLRKLVEDGLVVVKGEAPPSLRAVFRPN
jgi:glyoxylase-like metal-dependent hydrolase (beta-lactamase superfamily II)